MATCLGPSFKLDVTPEQEFANVRAHLQEEAEVMLDEDVEGSVEQGQEDPHPSEEGPLPSKKRKLGEIL